MLNNEDAADFVIMFSSEMISKVMEEYLNRKTLKQPIEIVDLAPTENGYAFSVRYKEKEIKQEKIQLAEYGISLELPKNDMIDKVIKEEIDRSNKIQDDIVRNTLDSLNKVTIKQRDKKGKFIKKC